MFHRKFKQSTSVDSHTSQLDKYKRMDFKRPLTASGPQFIAVGVGFKQRLKALHTLVEFIDIVGQR